MGNVIRRGSAVSVLDWVRSGRGLRQLYCIWLSEGKESLIWVLQCAPASCRAAQRKTHGTDERIDAAEAKDANPGKRKLNIRNFVPGRRRMRARGEWRSRTWRFDRRTAIEHPHRSVCVRLKNPCEN